MQQCWSANQKDRPSYKDCEKTIGDELKRCCQQCYDKVQSLLSDPKNNPDYSDLRQKMVDMKEAVDDGYEIPKHKKRQNLNHYYPTLTKEKSVDSSLLRV